MNENNNNGSMNNSADPNMNNAGMGAAGMGGSMNNMGGNINGIPGNISGIPGMSSAGGVGYPQNAGMNMYGVPPMTYIPLIKPKEYTAKESVFAFIALALGFAFIKLLCAPLLVDMGMGFGASVAMLLLTAYCAAYTKTRDRGHIFRIVLAAAFSVNIGICSMLLIQFLDAVFAMMLLIYDRFAVSDDSVRRIRRVLLTDAATAFGVAPLSAAGDMFGAVRSGTRGKTGTAVKNTIIGLIVAIPSTVIVAMLLSSADQGFANIMTNIAENGLENVLVACVQIGVGIPAAMYLFGSCFSSWHREEPYSENGYMTEAARIIPATAGVISAVPLCIMYVVFFCSQINNYLSSFIKVLPTGETYAEYARQGFFELCFVALIDLAVIGMLHFFCKRIDGKKANSVRIMTIVLCVFTLLLIATALAKMALYISVYGLTQLRTYTSWFMILLAILFVLIMLSAINEKINAPRIMTAVFIVMFSALSFLNTDGYIAQYNLERYMSGSLQHYNVSDLSELSSGAYPVVAKYMDSFSETDREKAENVIKQWHASGDFRTHTVNDILAGIDRFSA
ncbi:MAG: DUF4173 domain-containing protein [Oscillospiraceae bacterium]|nr:DUF4173 domain-containing protein [Oscillospiraceae bacterium]